ncbi:MAG: bifunctional DedA family/phosphatase PAP2 family protein [Thermoleophilaceae bacterium]|nr:bifunctional DedA family/phosphatase PAP2 family protein [Thermoleophilaceae bacterium]
MKGALREHRTGLLLAAVAAVVIGLYAAGVFPDLPDAEKVIEDVAQTLGPWTYALVAAAAFLETGAFVGLVAPGETTVIVAGVIAGQGEIQLLPLIGIVWLSCVAGDTASFFLGRRLGRDFLVRHGPKVKIDSERLEKVESYFDRHGGKTILVGRFIGLVRAVAPFVAGASGLRFGRFLPFSIIGCGLWSTLFCVLGFLFYRSFDRVAAVAGRATLAFGITVALVVAGVQIYRRLRREEERRRLSAWAQRQAARPLLRPVAAVLAAIWRRVVRPVAAVLGPPLRFVRDRLTPGELGLELTTAAAIALVGLYLFAIYASILAGGERLTPADRELLDLAGELRTDTALSVVEAITHLGSFATVATLLLGASILLALRRRFADLAVLVTGSVLIYVSVQLAKNGIDRSRPAAPLVEAEGESFPSGHAAYSTIWVGVAVAVARVVPGLARNAILIAVGLAIAAAVGLSRIYLRVHYWSDVAGGWGLGAGLMALCATVALVVAYIRQNGNEPAAAGGTHRKRP